MASLRPVPELVAYTSGVLGSFFSFFMGIAVGLFIAVLFLVGGAFMLTKRLTKEEPVFESTSAEASDDQLAETFHKNIQRPNIARKERFASYVWIVSGEKWDVAKPIHKFPPPDIGAGDTKGLMKYHAEVKDRVLRFSHVDELQKRQVMTIDLEGCRCRVVDESLGVKSMWWRKAPLELSHPSRYLYDGSTRLLMFCMHGADKEQWFISLRKFSDRGDSISVIEHLYKRFSKRFRRKTKIRFPSNPSCQSELKACDDRVAHEKNTWFNAWRRGNSFKQGTSSTSEVLQPVQPRTVEFAEDIEQLWNGGKSHSVFSEELARRPLRLPNNKRNKKTNRRSSSPPTKENSERESTPPVNVPTADTTERMNPSCSVPDAAEWPAFTPEPSSGGSEASIPVAPVKVQGKESDSKGSETAPGNSAEEGIYGLNMFLTRWAFDLARNPDFEEKFRQLMLKKLRGLRRPDYVTPLSLCGLDLGSNFPEIRSVRSLPPRGTVICPELLVDISYAGGLELTVETKVDLREGSVWGTLDRKLKNWQGNQATSRGREDTADLLQEQDIQEDISDSGTVQGDGDPRDPLGNGNRRQQVNGFSVRKFAASTAKQVAECVAESISKIPLRLAVRVVKLEGTLLLWISPPPAKRLWVSFMNTPTLEITANPIIANRLLKYSASLGRVSVWLQRKIQQSFFSNLVFPNCTDMSFPGLLGIDDAFGLRHPGRSVMTDISQISECESESSDTEAQSPIPVQAPAFKPPPAASSPEPTPLAAENLATQKPEIPQEKKTATNMPELPRDSRLDTIRQNRYDTQRLNSFRRTWKGRGLTEEDIPTREHHGRTVYKRCLSFSDGDVSDGCSEGEDEDCVMSDCIEFFDPEPSQTEITVTATAEEVASPPPVEIKWPTALPTARASLSRSPSNDACTPSFGNRSPTRGLSHRLGDFVRSVQSIAAEEREVSRRRFVQPGSASSNNLFQAAKQRAGERRQKVKDALESRTAQLKNAGLPRMWGQRRNP